MPHSINDGGPAFPHIDFEELRDGAASYTHPAKGGMTLRDYFAAKALPAVWAASMGPTNVTRDDTATECYRLADALILARNTPLNPPSPAMGGAIPTP